MTSATADSTTCWQTGATSTSSCSTPRCTRTPAGSSRSRRRSAPRPSSPPRASRSVRRIWACWRTCTVTSTSRRSRSAPRWRKPLRRFSKPNPTRALAHHRLQPLHRPRLRHGERRRAAEARGRLRRLAALPLRSAAHRQRGTAAAPRLRTAKGAGRRLHAQRIALPDGRARRSGSVQEIRRGLAGGRRTPLCRLSTARRHQRARDDRHEADPADAEEK